VAEGGGLLISSKQLAHSSFKTLGSLPGTSQDVLSGRKEADNAMYYATILAKAKRTKRTAEKNRDTLPFLRLV
jgi:hypothetical protein